MLFHGLHENFGATRAYSLRSNYILTIYMHKVLLNHSLLLLMGYFRELSNLLIIRKLQARKLI